MNLDTPSSFPLIDVITLSQKTCKNPIECTLAYATTENFLGRIVKGYSPQAKHVCFMAPKAAKALCQVQNQLNENNLGLFIFDSFRPLRAVKDFGQWMHQSVEDTQELTRKKIHYPHVEKNQLAELGYVNDHVSNHCFGDTVDLTLIQLSDKSFLDMGACFDFFDDISHQTATAKMIGEIAYQNRQLLLQAMQTAGYLPYEKEYWHFTYHEREVKEPLDREISMELMSSTIAFI